MTAQESREVAGKVERATLRQTLTAWHLILLVVAAAAPMAAVVGIVPVALGLGNGAGFPLTLIAVIGVLALFSVGYSAMSRRVVSTGAFYSYVTHGLGGVPGLGAAFVALTSYVAITVGAIAYFAFFAQLAVADLLGWSGSWIWFAASGALLLAGLGYRGIDVSFRLIAVLLVAEFAILLCLVAAIIARLGWAAFPLDSFTLPAATSGAPGISVMLAFLLFIGFESAALYSEETRDPRRSVSRATYGALVVMGGFYLVTTWVTVGAIGSERVSGVAGSAAGNLYFDLAADYIGPWIIGTMGVLMATSMFATALALHNVASRYLFSLGRQRCLPSLVGKVHDRHGVPHRASVAVSVTTGLVVLTGFLLGMSPMVGLGTVSAGLGTVGIMALQCMASLGVIGYFRKRGDGRAWPTLVAPLLAFVGMTAGVFLAVSRFDLLSGASNPVVNALPVLLVVAFVGGAAYGLALKGRRPDTYRRLTHNLATDEAALGVNDFTP